MELYGAQRIKNNAMSNELIGRKFSPIKSTCPQILVKKFGAIPKQYIYHLAVSLIFILFLVDWAEDCQ